MYECSVRHASLIYKFTGKERDAESGLDNFGARYDSSSMGRFMSADPKHINAHLFDPQSFNRYLFTRDNPLSYVDPDGKDWQTAWSDVKTFVNSIYGHVIVGGGLEAKGSIGPFRGSAGVAAKISGGAPPLAQGVADVKTTVEYGGKLGVGTVEGGPSNTIVGPNVTLKHMDGTVTSEPMHVEQSSSGGNDKASISADKEQVGVSVEMGLGVIAGGDLGATKEGWRAAGDALVQAVDALYTPPPPSPNPPAPPTSVAAEPTH